LTEARAEAARNIFDWFLCRPKPLWDLALLSEQPVFWALWSVTPSWPELIGDGQPEGDCCNSPKNGRLRRQDPATFLASDEDKRKCCGVTCTRGDWLTLE